ncbi:MAG: rhomboid family intramembrane serine protease [Flavobacteriales bacterium]|nr:rhomboid family intramembrane serine protease [Flavobacteriales bacterium]
MSSFLADLKTKYKNGSWPVRLIIANVALFVVALIVHLIAQGFSNGDQFIYNFYVPLNFKEFLFQPWSLVTYMFLHSFSDIFHILYNLLFLYWFGDMALRIHGNRSVLANYLMGGLLAAFVFGLIGNVFTFSNYGTHLVGASGAVYAIVFSVILYQPNQKINLLFIGPVAIKYLGIFMVLVDVLKISQGDNTGGQFAHFGGLLWGALFTFNIKKGRDINGGMKKFIEFISTLTNKSKRKQKFRVVHNTYKTDEEYNLDKRHQQKKVDEILDKISKSGYDSLSKEEKDFLFKASNQ